MVDLTDVDEEKEMEMERYRIGHLDVMMTVGQADRWNRGESTDDDIRSMIVSIPMSDRGLPIHEDMSMREAMTRFAHVESVVNDGYEAEKV